MSARKVLIVGHGDSTTAGTPGFLSPLEAPPEGSGNPESQYTYWMTELRPEWTVLNRGIAGERTDQILARFPRDVLAASPDYVIILSGVNDIYQGSSQDTIRRNLLSMYELARKNGIRVVGATVLPYNYASETESETIIGLNEWIMQTANRLELLFCDTNSAVSDSSDPHKLASTPDGLHPDVAGYQRMGEALTRVIDSSLR